jgi:predicted neuraminidase
MPAYTMGTFQACLLVICPQPGTMADRFVALRISLLRSESAIYTESLTMGLLATIVVSVLSCNCADAGNTNAHSAIIANEQPKSFKALRLLNGDTNEVQYFIELL